jgi:3-oxoacyl-[acyl-carrier protein] reductase
MDLGLEGKHALVMAASRGLGRAVAEMLAREGAHVAISSIDPARCEQAAAEIAQATGGVCRGFAADMFDPAAMDTLVARAEAALGPIDILFINHAGPALGLAQAVDFDVLDAHYRLMVASPLRLIGRVLPSMRGRRWGRILSVGGGSMVHALPNKSMDNIFRPALVNYTKALANEVAADGVTANMILPGTFVTDRVHDSTEKNAKLWGISVDEAMRRRIEGIPAARFGDLAEFAAVATFLCSAPASYMTGSIVRVDGGQTKTIL